MTVAHAKASAGFSLIELAVVLVIIGLLVGGGIAALTAATDQARRSEAGRQLDHIREALYGFAMSNGRLPCPDTDDPPDGVEDTAAGDCAEAEGALPWVELGLGRRDPWGNPLRYRVQLASATGCGPPNFADPGADPDNPAFALDDCASIEVQDGDGNVIVGGTPAVVVSYGPQGSQVWTAGGFQCPGDGIAANGFSDNETENCGVDADLFVSAGYRRAESGERFDDVVVWLPTPLLKGRMVEAGLLP